MGFNRNSALNALTTTNNDISLAMNVLLQESWQEHQLVKNNCLFLSMTRVGFTETKVETLICDWENRNSPIY